MASLTSASAFPVSQDGGCKTEVVKFHVLQQIDTRFQQLYLGFRDHSTLWTHCQYRTTSADTRRRRPIRRYRKRKMATAKPEVVISHVLQQIDTWFERLYPGFPSHPTGWTHHQHPPTSTDTGNARWRPPNRK